MATEEKVTKDPTLEHQLAKVAELGKDPDNTAHTSEAPSAPELSLSDDWLLFVSVDVPEDSAPGDVVSDICAPDCIPDD